MVDGEVDSQGCGKEITVVICERSANDRPYPISGPAGFWKNLLLLSFSCSRLRGEAAHDANSPSAPYWPENLLKRGIRPAAKGAKIMKHISWHTFRMTFFTLLKTNGEDIKTVQELLRHAIGSIILAVATERH
jgi:integrase